MNNVKRKLDGVLVPMFDSKRKERLQKQMIKDTPFFVKKAIPVKTQDVANRDAKVNSALLDARQRFEK
jgi:hypothetical protein